MNGQDKSSINIAHRVNLLVIVLLVCLLCGQLVMTKGIEKSIVYLFAGGIAILLAVINYFLPINKHIKGLFLHYYLQL